MAQKVKQNASQKVGHRSDCRDQIQSHLSTQSPYLLLPPSTASSTGPTAHRQYPVPVPNTMSANQGSANQGDRRESISAERQPQQQSVVFKDSKDGYGSLRSVLLRLGACFSFLDISGWTHSGYIYRHELVHKLADLPYCGLVDLHAHLGAAKPLVPVFLVFSQEGALQAPRGGSQALHGVQEEVRP